MQRLLLPLVIVVALICLQAVAQEPEVDPTRRVAPVTVILVRHAETVAGHDSDRALNEVGRRRAEDLARLLGHAGVTHLYSSEFPRTGQTLAPLVRVTGLEVLPISAREGARQVAALADLAPGSVAVVAGHSNTVPTLVAELGGEIRDLEGSRYGPVFGDKQFDRMIVLTLPAHPSVAVKTVELRYGE